ncbi:restriction endonuclease subunit S [Sulfuriroseicoccus oceanibius]|uniref:Restriction endonuclease subunit S n=1 Tax=Sulfuriroseicoccus oceanibius TaxID=2707525 RepID=A0A6B3L7E4_9BACT|nr:restriction endonuclease subunit S [Sulfuriroseicoccus oceanibius]QQL43934.1 restriction endonuclease subunit S [Sulfuriroseicoccus oceanibius]
MSEETTLVPNLRFQEFPPSSQTGTISQLCKIVDCEHKTAPYVSHSEYAVVRTSNIRNGTIVHDDMKFTSKEGYREWTRRTIPIPGDLLFTREAPAGETCLVPKDFKLCMGQRMVLLRSHDNQLDHGYLLYYILSPAGERQIYRYEIGSTVKRINIEDIARIAIHLPSLPEQKKIAAFLSAVDARIDQLKRKKSLLLDYKKGVMQKLFSQELRFKDDQGNPFPDWEEKKLGEVTKWSSGGTPSKDNDSYWNGEIPWMSAISMHGRYYSDSKLRLTAEGVKSGSKIASKGSLLLLVRGSMLWNRIPVGITMREVAYNQDVKALTPASDLSPAFLLQWFIASENILLHKVVGTGIGAGKLDTDEMKHMPIQLPSISEQIKIASFLTELDRKIEQADAQITHTHTFKKGLLQQMFV